MNARTREVMTRGWDHGSWLPPVLSPSRSKTREATSVVAPRKSMRRSGGFLLGLIGMSIRNQTMMVETTMKGTWKRNAQRQEMLSANPPPTIPPRPIPIPKTTLP